MKIAILGYGSIAQAHARAIQTLRTTAAGSDLYLSGVMGRDPDGAAAFAREFGLVTWTTDLDELLADPHIDALIVCSPSPRHAEQTERALAAGKHVLCEIPLALSLAETDRLIHLAAETGRRLMVCHTRRYQPALIEARRLITAGEIHPHATVVRYLFDRRGNVNWQGRRRAWTDNLLWHHGCHAVDTALWLLGVPEHGGTVETMAQVALPGGDLDIPMDLGLVMRAERDQIATVALSYHSRIPVEDYLIIGEETTLFVADRCLRDQDRVLVDALPQDGSDAPIAQQDAEFIAAIRDDREPAVSARSIRPAMAVLQAAQDTLGVRMRTLGADARHPRLP